MKVTKRAVPKSDANKKCVQKGRTSTLTTLPPLSLPVFDGRRITEYNTFIENFKAVIDKDSSIVPVQKLLYLRKCLRNEAYVLVEGLPLVKKSYLEALKLLEEKYSEKSNVITHYVNNLLDIQPVSNVTALSLRNFVCQTGELLQALNGLGQPVAQWDMVVLPILYRKLDADTCRAYHTERDRSSLPNLNEFFEFLERRATYLEESLQYEVANSSPQALNASDAIQKYDDSENECLEKVIKTDYDLLIEKTIDIEYVEVKPTVEKINTPTSLRFQCENCSYFSVTAELLQRHSRLHDPARRFECNICHYRFKINKHLTSHLKSHTNNKPYKCELCNYSGIERGNLNTHMRTHTKEKPLKCELCEYRCYSKHHLKLHMNKHTKVKPFKCNLCEYRCAESIYLKKHLRTHTRERPFICDMCGCGSATKDQLRIHILRHTNEKKFHCKLCDYKSVAAAGLMTHMRTHTKLKPFKCDLCEYRATQKSHVKTHMKMHQPK